MKALWRYIGVVLFSAAVIPACASAQDVSLPITPHRQEHSLSCEIATLKMALGVHGVNISESALISRLPFDKTPKTDGVWGDPHKGFVGSINGRMLVNGYGVYWEPIAQVGKAYAKTEIMEHGSAKELAQNIKAGNPVIIWGYYGPERRLINWHTPQGKAIKAIDGEHTRLVYGFDGSVESPTRFYLIDPASGAFSWSTEKLMHNWSSLNHMGVIVSAQAQWVRVPGEKEIWEIDTHNKTRRWVKNWQAFVKRGGSLQAVEVIERGKLLKYKIGSPIN